MTRVVSADSGNPRHLHSKGWEGRQESGPCMLALLPRLGLGWGVKHLKANTGSHNNFELLEAPGGQEVPRRPYPSRVVF